MFTEQLFGGAIIGLAVSIMLIFNGRVTGISGIVSQILKLNMSDFWWRVLFVFGLVVGGFVVQAINPTAIGPAVTDTKGLIIAGLIVGYGTVMGSGCTSGHAVCGISRFSKRSIVSTVVFMAFGFLTASIIQLIKGV
jgi:uncharacterized membrane protein YedE/YeeE